jgi:hypothetical protein
MAMCFQPAVLLWLVTSNTLGAQQNSCPLNLPLGIVGTNGDLLNGLTPQDVTVRVHKQKLPIETIQPETSN